MLTVPTGATDWYVSPSGDDGTGDGPVGNPWRTISHAAASSVANDRIIVAAGNYSPASGESYPIVMRHGLEIIGPAPGGVATVESPPNVVMFDVSALHWVIEGLELNNTVGAGSPLPMFTNEQTGAVGGALRNNTLTIARGGLVADDVRDLTVSGNVFLDAPNSFHGNALDMEIRWRQFALTVRNNTISGFRQAIHVRLDTRATSGGSFPTGNCGSQGELCITIQDNVIEDPLRSGIRFTRDTNAQYLAGYFPSLSIKGNRITGAGEHGVDVNWKEHSFNGRVSVIGSIEHNLLTGNTLSGLHYFGELTVISTSSFCCGVYAEFEPTISGNTLAANGENGFKISALETGFGYDGARLRPPDLGGEPGGLSTGRNTFEDNGDYSIFAFSEPWDYGDPLYCVGNWWGTKDPVQIASRIWDENDHGAEASDVDADLPLDGALNFTAAPHGLAAGGGELVTVTADPATFFVPSAGGTPIGVQIAGLDALSPSVTPDGAVLTFVKPAFPSAGPVLLVITNPGGQTGSALLKVKPDVPHQQDGPLAAH